MIPPETAKYSARLESALRPRRPPSATHPLLLYGTLLGLHVNLGLPVFDGIVPNIIAAPFALSLIALHWRRLPNRAAPWLLALIGFFAISAMYAIGFQDASAAALLPVGLLGYTMLLGLGMFLEITAMSREKLNRLAQVLSIGMISLAVLEVYTPVQEIAIWFEQFHLNRVSGSLRDSALFGGYRPKLFASEPSRAAIGLAVALSVWAFTTKRWSQARVAFFGALMLCALFLIRSPFIVLPALLFGARLVLWPERGFEARRQGIGSQAGRLVVVFVGGLLATILLASALGATFGTRISEFNTRSDWSVTVRTYGAVLAGWNAATVRPLFGAGVNNFQAAPEVAATFHALGVPTYVTETDALNASVANGLAVSLIYFGFGGLLCFLWIWGGLMRALCPQAPWTMRWAVLICVAASYSEIYAPAFVWTALVLLGGLVVAAKPQPTHPPAASPRRDPTLGFPQRPPLRGGRW